MVVKISLTTFNLLNDFLTLVYPKSFLTIGTVGYADDSETGIYQTDFVHNIEVFQIQLYNFVALINSSLFTLEDMTIVELGCRKGGGLAYLNQIAEPERAIGVDTDERNIEFCKANYRSHKNLEFLTGDGKNLKHLLKGQGSKLVDVVLSIESSHEDEDLKNHFDQVAKILKPRGWFLYADVKEVNSLTDLESLFNDHFEIVKSEDIKIKVLQA
jgi:SAM-dependent methyltransferase